MEELVKYNNDLNRVAFRGFSAENYDLLMAIISRMRDKDDQVITLSYARIRELIKYPKKKSNVQLTKDLDNMWDTLKRCECTLPRATGNSHMVLFPTYTTDSSTASLKIRINSDFAYLIQDFKGYTEFELKRFISIKSKYGKVLYRLLRQYRNGSEHVYRISIEDLKRLFDVPESYTTKEITRKVVKPAVEECKADFKDLTVSTYKLRKQGCPIGGYAFSWTPMGQVPGQMTIDDYARSQKKTTKKKGHSTEKNSFQQFEQNSYDYDELEEQIMEK